jgi:hypothetical protein
MLQKPTARDSVRSTRTPTSTRTRPMSQSATGTRQRGIMHERGVGRHRFVNAVAAHSTSQKRSFELRWAKLRTDADSMESYVSSESRAVIINELYPRLLYAFSDVVAVLHSSVINQDSL